MKENTNLDEDVVILENLNKVESLRLSTQLKYLQNENNGSKTGPHVETLCKDKCSKNAEVIELGNSSKMVLNLQCKNCNQTFSKNFELLKHLSVCNEFNSATKKRKFEVINSKNHTQINIKKSEEVIEVLSEDEQEQAEKTGTLQGNNNLVYLTCIYFVYLTSFY